MAPPTIATSGCAARKFTCRSKRKGCEMSSLSIRAIKSPFTFLIPLFSDLVSPKFFAFTTTANFLQSCRCHLLITSCKFSSNGPSSIRTIWSGFNVWSVHTLLMALSKYSGFSDSYTDIKTESFILLRKKQ